MLAPLQLFYTSTGSLGLLDEKRRQSAPPSPQMVALDGFPEIHTWMQGDVRAAALRSEPGEEFFFERRTKNGAVSSRLQMQP